MEGKSIKRYPLSRQIADLLENMIEAGVYPVGRKIPTEPALMEMFSVSRNTLREAIRSLSSAGILEVKQGDGTYVISNNRFHGRMSVEYERASLEDIQEAQNALEVTIVQMTAKRRTDDDLLRIGAALSYRQKLNEIEKENTWADKQYHLSIAQACKNKVLLDLYLSISAYLEPHVSPVQEQNPVDAGKIDALHDALFFAIRDQAPDTAAACIQGILHL